MLDSLSRALELSEAHGLPLEDVLFIDLNCSGIESKLPHSRIRFELMPEDESVFKTSLDRGVGKYFFGLPIRWNSKYSLKDQHIEFVGKRIARANGVANDTCDTTYPRRNGTVLNLNSNSKSQCHGCAFCHTVKQTPRDRGEVHGEPALRGFIDKWLEQYQVNNLSHLIQVAVVTGCFGGEQIVLDDLKMVRRVFQDYGFVGELFYFGSEITAEESLDELERIKPITLGLSVECFDNRERMLRDVKRRLVFSDIERILRGSKERGLQTTFSYIVGIEPLVTAQRGFEQLLPTITRFPIINVFQPHSDAQERLRHPDAMDITYFIQARQMFERMFKDTTMRPRPWENYRGLWYLNFADERLTDIRTP